jgi:hypothetical protein
VFFRVQVMPSAVVAASVSFALEFLHTDRRADQGVSKAAVRGDSECQSHRSHSCFPVCSRKAKRLVESVEWSDLIQRASKPFAGK